MSMSITNIACFKLDGEMTIQFQPSSPATAPPADGGPPPPPGGQHPPRQDNAPAPNAQLVHQETLEAVQGLVTRRLQVEAGRAQDDHHEVNKRVYDELEQVEERLARLEEGRTRKTTSDQ